MLMVFGIAVASSPGGNKEGAFSAENKDTRCDRETGAAAGRWQQAIALLAHDACRRK